MCCVITTDGITSTTSITITVVVHEPLLLGVTLLVHGEEGVMWLLF